MKVSPTPYLLALALAISGNASAAIVTYTYTGTVTDNSYDLTGIFGLGAGSWLTGQQVTAVFVRDDSIPGIQTSATSPPSQSSTVYGYGSSAPLRSYLTINGHTFSFGTESIVSSGPLDEQHYRYSYQIQGNMGSGNNPGYIHASQYSYETHKFYISQDDYILNSYFIYTNLNFHNNDGSLTTDYNSLNSQTLAGNYGAVWDGSALIRETSYPNPADIRYTSVNMAFDALTVSTSAAPEPTTWALMMVGIGGIGATLRTRRRKASTV